MTIHNGTPNSRISHSKSKPMTTNRSFFSSTTYIRLSNMIPLQLIHSINYRAINKYFNHIPMMTRHYPRKYIPRTSHSCRTKRTTIWNNTIHCLRSVFLRWVFLSILPLQLSSYTRFRRLLTTNRDFTTKSSRSPTTKHISSSSLRCLNYMGPPQPNRRKTERYKSSSVHYHYIRTILYCPTSLRILRNYIFYLRQHLRVNILHSNRVSRSTRNHRNDLLNRMPPSTIKISLHTKTPLWFRSSSMILTFCRCSLAIPIRVYLLMRVMLS